MQHNQILKRTIEFSYENLAYKFPVIGDYSIKDFLDFIGLKNEDLDADRTILESNEFKSLPILNSKIRAVDNQIIRTYQKSNYSLLGQMKLRGAFDVSKGTTLRNFLDNK